LLLAKTVDNQLLGVKKLLHEALFRKLGKLTSADISKKTCPASVAFSQFYISASGAKFANSCVWPAVIGKWKLRN
jgi:hypothetical protein